MSCDLKTSLMCPSGKTHGLTQRAVAAHAAGSGGFPGRLAGLAVRVRLLANAPEARRPA